MNRTATTIIVILVLLVLAALIYGLVQNGSTSSPGSTGQTGSPATGQICTLEAKLCPDGSYVGRTGPNCSFAPCPGGASTTASTTP